MFLFTLYFIWTDSDHLLNPDTIEAFFQLDAFVFPLVNTIPVQKQNVIWSYSKESILPFPLSSIMLIWVPSYCRSIHRLQHTEHGAGFAWRWGFGGMWHQWRLHQHRQTLLERGSICINVVLVFKTLCYHGVPYIMCDAYCKQHPVCMTHSKTE